MAEEKYTAHPIQLHTLDVQELHFSAKGDLSKSDQLTDSMFKLVTKHTSYDSELKRIGVKLEIKMGYGEEPDSSIEPIPFKLWVTIAGLFTVDDDRFDSTFVEDWAKKNAPLILYPYLRENAYSLAIRCGFRGLLLPLFEVPTIKYSEPNAE